MSITLPFSIQMPKNENDLGVGLHGTELFKSLTQYGPALHKQQLESFHLKPVCEEHQAPHSETLSPDTPLKGL